MASCADLRKLACILWLCALPGLARAQAADTGADTTAADASDPADAAAAPAAPAVLFLMPRDEEQTQAQLRDALLAQFALIDATLVFEPKPEGEASIATRVQQAQALAAQYMAIAVFWIEASADGRWLLHMMDTQDQRVVVRQVDAAGERRPAAIEAVAVMTRSGTRALIEGIPEALPPAVEQTPPAPPSASALPASRLDAFRLWLGYTGSAFAPEVAWQHGAALGATWLGPHPFFLGLSLILTPTLEPNASSTSPATFSVQRTPIAAQVGYRYLTGRIALDGELGFVIERWFRPAAEARQLMGQTTDPTDATTHWVYELAPRLRCELRIASIMGLYGGGGLDILLNKFKYVSEGQPNPILLQPNPFRPVAELGISFYP
jgi:hypothetical protein